MKQEQAQDMRLEDLRVLQVGQNALITSLAMGIAANVLRAAFGEHSAEDGIPQERIHGLQARFARAAALRMHAQELFDADVTETGVDAHHFEQMKEHIAREFRMWWLEQQANPSRYCRFPQERAAAPRQEHHDIQATLDTIDLSFRVDWKKRLDFEDVRNARIEEITADSVRDMLPAINRAYDRAFLEPQTVELLRHNDAAANRSFRERTKQGVFVYGFHEKPDGKPSVAEQLVADFTAARKPDDPVYHGWILRQAGDADIQAFMTLWQPPRSPDRKRHERMIRHYLHSGVTGGRMRYTRKPKKEEILPHAADTVMIDTICGSQRFAAARLFQKGMRKVTAQSDVPHKLFIGYRLHELFFEPGFDAHREPLRFSDNVSSAHFFESRDCCNFAYDYNQKGLSSTRTLDDGSVLRLHPEWLAFVGHFHAVTEASDKIWQSIQGVFGDVSDD